MFDVKNLGGVVGMFDESVQVQEVEGVIVYYCVVGGVMEQMGVVFDLVEEVIGVVYVQFYFMNFV